MQLAYLILAHSNPRHLQRLVRALSSPSSATFVHLDKKSEWSEFANIDLDGVEFIRPRLPVYWGDFSMVQATLSLIRRALADPRCFDRLALLSGADYPLHPAWRIEEFLQRHTLPEFIEANRMPTPWHFLSRLADFQPSQIDPLPVKLWWKTKATLGIRPRPRDFRNGLGGRVPFSGSQWWILSRAACQFILETVDSSRRLMTFFRNTHCPDEMFFQTLLVNSHFRTRLSHSLTYVDWNSRGPLPAWINESHLGELGHIRSLGHDDAMDQHVKLFARKFSDDSGAIVSALQETEVARVAS